MRSFMLAVLTVAVSIGSAFANPTHVTWNKAASLDNVDFSSQGLTDRTSNVVFIRPHTGNPLSATSVNLAVNDEFLSSIQDGYYTSAVVCTWNTRLSAYPTAAKSNDLLANAQVANLQPGHVHFYEVVVNPGVLPQLRAIDTDTARQMLQGAHRQNHQISRVHTPTNCQEPPRAQYVPPVVTQPVVQQSVTPPQQEDPSLRLNILFDHDKHNLKPMYRSEVERAAQFLANYPNMDAMVEGHTDSNGDAKYNQGLSQRRAETVRQALIDNHNISPNRLTAVGYGEERPVADNSTSAGRQENRRVIISIPAQ